MSEDSGVVGGPDAVYWPVADTANRGDGAKTVRARWAYVDVVDSDAGFESG